MNLRMNARYAGRAVAACVLAFVAGCSSTPTGDHASAGGTGAVTTGNDNSGGSAAADGGASDATASNPYALTDAIFEVVAHGASVDTVKDLIENHGADPNAKDADGDPTLIKAWNSQLIYWHPTNQALADLITYLLSKGADPNQMSRRGNSILQAAAYDGNMLVLPILVKAGANVNAKNASGETVLDWAAKCDFRLSCDDCTSTPMDADHLWKQGAKPAIAYLLDHGADITAHTPAPDNKSVLDFVPTPCSFSPNLCTADALPNAEWPSGSCKETYLFVEGKLSAH